MESRPSNPALAEQKLRATLADVKIKDAEQEVTAATVKFTEGVGVITEALLLILQRFRGIVWRTNAGMLFGAAVLLTSLVVMTQTMDTARSQEENNRKLADLAVKLEDAARRLDKIQRSTATTEIKMEAVRLQSDQKPNIEIVPDQARPGNAKVVIKAHAASSSTLPAPDESGHVVEIPIQMPRLPLR